MEWLYFVLGLIAWQIIKMLAWSINQMVIEHRQKQFLKLVRIEFKDHSWITFVSADSSDRKAMRDLEKQIRADYEDLPDGETK